MLRFKIFEVVAILFALAFLTRCGNVEGNELQSNAKPQFVVGKNDKFFLELEEVKSEKEESFYEFRFCRTGELNYNSDFKEYTFKLDNGCINPFIDKNNRALRLYRLPAKSFADSEALSGLLKGFAGGSMLIGTAGTFALGAYKDSAVLMLIGVFGMYITITTGVMSLVSPHESYWPYSWGHSQRQLKESRSAIFKISTRNPAASRKIQEIIIQEDSKKPIKSIVASSQDLLEPLARALGKGVMVSPYLKIFIDKMELEED